MSVRSELETVLMVWLILGSMAFLCFGAQAEDTFNLGDEVFTCGLFPINPVQGVVTSPALGYTFSYVIFTMTSETEPYIVLVAANLSGINSKAYTGNELTPESARELGIALGAAGSLLVLNNNQATDIDWGKAQVQISYASANPKGLVADQSHVGSAWYLPDGGIAVFLGQTTSAGNLAALIEMSSITDPKGSLGLKLERLA